jgi:tryptophan synthase beta chain
LQSLSKEYNTKVYLKEKTYATLAHKINNTIGQILLAKRLGKTRIAETELRHGVATATVCFDGLQCIVYMGEVDIKRQCSTYENARCRRPSTSGSKTLKDATNEAIRDWINNPVDTIILLVL